MTTPKPPIPTPEETYSSIERTARKMVESPRPDIASRIEAIIYRELDYYGNNLSGHLADVLVRELRLGPGLKSRIATVLQDEGASFMDSNMLSRNIIRELWELV
jgi:hypothetical protein